MTGQETLAALLVRCADGDKSAMEVLYRSTSAKLYGIALALLKREDLAEDVMQEAFIKIWNRAASYDSSKGAPMTWMSSIVRNRALDMLRSVPIHMEMISEPYEDVDLPEPVNDTPAIATLDLGSEVLRDCFGQLQETQRRSILLAYYYGHTHGELAELLGTPLGTVKAWIRRGMERLRECLD